MSRVIVPPVSIEYPSGDGKPMAENDAQLAAILYGVGALRVHFEARQDVYVSGDLLMYYEEGNPRESVAPDVFVGVGGRGPGAPALPGLGGGQGAGLRAGGGLEEHMA